ncbi:hypothetical protein KI387_025364 [Taxus chinensis]|uniref:Reverse transcriptase Ty1/copia-type domain-containing protein n=1 Tax=Taxus chinensis TaxID=29808 RepID=A0AA38G5U2_TAXCH|nr:hypothetical protein KI387_025364 [Taxus chinensis]
MGRGKIKQKQKFIGKTGKHKEETPDEDLKRFFSEKDMDDEIDIFHKQRDKIPLDLNEDDDTSDEEREQPVFGLQGESSEEMEESDSEDEEQLTGLAAKIAKQAKFLRQKAGGVEDEMEEEPVEEEEERKAIQSSDEELPAEEEAEVLILQRKKAETLRPEDFGLDEDASDVDSDAHEETLQEAVKRHEGGIDWKMSKETLNRDLGKQVDDDRIVAFEEVKKDLNALSKEQQMEVVMSDAPELVGLLSEFKDGLDQLRNVQPLLQKVKANKNATKEGLNYLEAKQLVLLCYCQSIVFYLLLKAEGRSVRDHPVIARLVEMRNLLDKIRPFDIRLKNQIERILQEDESDLIKRATEKDVMNPISVGGVLSELKPDETIQESFQDKKEFFAVDLIFLYGTRTHLNIQQEILQRSRWWASNGLVSRYDSYQWRNEEANAGDSGKIHGNENRRSSHTDTVSKLKAQASGFRGYSAWFKVYDSGFGVQSYELKVYGLVTEKEQIGPENSANYEQIDIGTKDKPRLVNIVPRPTDRAVVGSRWIFKIKHGADGSIEKYKTRFVVKGFSQKEGIDYEETFAPVARYTSIRAVISFTMQMGWQIHQMDVKTTFLNGELKEEVYIEQLEGFVAHNKETHVCRLMKSLYGLK